MSGSGDVATWTCPLGESPKRVGYGSTSGVGDSPASTAPRNTNEMIIILLNERDSILMTISVYAVKWKDYDHETNNVLTF